MGNRLSKISKKISKITEAIIQSIKAKILKILDYVDLARACHIEAGIKNGEGIIRAEVNNSIIPVASKLWKFPFTVKKANVRVEAALSFGSLFMGMLAKNAISNPDFKLTI